MKSKAGLAALVVMGAILGLTAVSHTASAYEFYGMVLPDISLQDIIDYFTSLVQNPNIYADFDLDSFQSFLTQNYLGRYFSLALICIYFLAVLVMLFGLRRARKAGE